jgi:hypothetical protein
MKVYFYPNIRTYDLHTPIPEYVLDLFKQSQIPSKKESSDGP